MPAETLDSFLCVALHTIASRAETFGMKPASDFMNLPTDNIKAFQQLYDVLKEGGHEKFLKQSFQDLVYARPLESIRDIIQAENLTVEQTFSIFIEYVNDTDFGDDHVYKRFLLGYISDKTGVTVS